MSLKRFRRDREKMRRPCYYCTRIMAPPHSVEANFDLGLLCTNEHLIPQKNGGTDESYNIRLACHRCNGLRGSIDPDLFYEFALVVLRQYPNAPTVILRSAMREYIETLAVQGLKNNKAKNHAGRIALLHLADDSYSYAARRK